MGAFPKTRPHGALSWARGLRAVLFGMLLVLLLTALTLHSNLRYNRYITASSLPSGAVFFFVVALVGNALVRRVWRRAALSVAELAIIFSMLFISAALPQASIAETLVTLAVAPVYLPRGAPAVDLFENRVPRWLLVQDGAAIRRFYEGYGPAGGPVPWAAWVAPLAGWSVFVVLLLGAMYCLSRAFTHRWIHEERVVFPLMELPLELLNVHESPTPIWRNPLTYLGAAIPATMILIGQAHSYYPTIPASQQIVSVKVGAAFPVPPLSALSDFTLSFWPMVIGISYLLNAEVAISIWLFHLLFWGQLVFWAAVGYPWQEGAPGGRGFQPLEWIHNTEFGGALVLATLLLWPLRNDVARATRALWERSPAPPDLPVPPWAVAGFALANAGMLVWGWAAGASVVAVAVFLVFLYAIVIALGRMVAAGGLYLVDNGFTPQTLLYGLGGVGALDKGSHFVLTGQESLFGRADMSFFYFAVNDSKVVHDTSGGSRWHGVGVVVAVGTTLVSAYALILLWSYQYGAATLRAWPFSGNVTGMFDQTRGFLAALQRGPNPWTYGGIVAGMGIALFLVFMNRNFLWWRISPFGFVVASSWNISNQIWSSVLCGWLIASVVRRYGGVRVYGRLRPFFLGLILGDAVTFCLMAVLESLIGVRSGV